MAKKFLVFLFVLSGVTLGHNVWATDGDSEDSQATQNVDDIGKNEKMDNADKTAWRAAIQKKFAYTDEQMKSLDASGLNYAQLSMVAILSARSGKTTDEILKMRSEQKMGWGQIAQTLGVQPGELGRGVAELRHEIHKPGSSGEGEKNRAEHSKEKAKEKIKEKAKERRADRQERRKDRQERRKDRRNERTERKGGRGHS